MAGLIDRNYNIYIPIIQPNYETKIEANQTNMIKQTFSANP